MVFLLSRMSTKIDFCGATGRDHDGWQVAAAKETDTTSTAEAATLGDEDTGTSSGGRGNIGITMTVMTGFEDNNTVRALHRCQRWRQYDNDDHDDDNGNSCQISLAQLRQRQPSNYDDNPRTESFAVLRSQRLRKYDDDGDSRQTSFAALRQRRPSNHDGHSRQSFAALRQRRPSNHDGDSLQA